MESGEGLSQLELDGLFVAPQRGLSPLSPNVGHFGGQPCWAKPVSRHCTPNRDGQTCREGRKATPPATWATLMWDGAFFVRQ